jgi:hypothetical protein
MKTDPYNLLLALLWNWGGDRPRTCEAGPWDWQPNRTWGCQQQFLKSKPFRNQHLSNPQLFETNTFQNQNLFKSTTFRNQHFSKPKPFKSTTLWFGSIPKWNDAIAAFSTSPSFSAPLPFGALALDVAIISGPKSFARQ